MATGELKISTVEVDTEHNMATLPVSRAHHDPEVKNAPEPGNKDLELRFVQEKPEKR